MVSLGLTDFLTAGKGELQIKGMEQASPHSIGPGPDSAAHFYPCSEGRLPPEDSV